MIEEKLRDGYFVIPVFSALKRDASSGRPKVAITDLLLDYRNIITGAATMRDGVKEFRRRLLEPHLELMRDLQLIPADTGAEEARKAAFHQAPGQGGPWQAALDDVYREVNSIVGDATTFCKFIPGPGAIDNFVSGGERLSVAIMAAYFNMQWKESGFGWRAEPATAKEIGVLTDGNFGDARILDDSLRLVYHLAGHYKKRGVMPVVTGFDGIYKVEENGKTFRYRTTLGRSGSDLTATFLGYALVAEATCLVKDTDGVLTANPKLVPQARTIDYLSYDLAVEAGNIQNKAVKPSRDGQVPLLVFNPKNREAVTRVGSEPTAPGPRLITDPVACRFVRVTLGEPEEFFALTEVMRRHGARALEIDARGDVATFIQAGAKSLLQFEEEMAVRLGWRVEAAPAWRVKVVGELRRSDAARFNQFIEQFKPLSNARWHAGAKALTACFPQDGVEVAEILRAIHDEFIVANGPPAATEPQRAVERAEGSG